MECAPGEHYPMPALGANMAETRGFHSLKDMARNRWENSQYLAAGVVSRITATLPGLRCRAPGGAHHTVIDATHK